MRRIWKFAKTETVTKKGEKKYTSFLENPNGVAVTEETLLTVTITSTVAVEGKTWHLARLAAATLLGAPPEDLICTIKP